MLLFVFSKQHNKFICFSIVNDCLLVNFLVNIFLSINVRQTGYSFPFFHPKKGRDEEKQREVAKPVFNHFLSLCVIPSCRSESPIFSLWFNTIKSSTILHFFLSQLSFLSLYSAIFVSLFKSSTAKNLAHFDIEDFTSKSRNAFVVRRKAISLKIYCTFCIFYYYFLIIQSIWTINEESTKNKLVSNS